jgi:hypothetical protein
VGLSLSTAAGLKSGGIGGTIMKGGSTEVGLELRGGVVLVGARLAVVAERLGA